MPVVWKWIKTLLLIVPLIIAVMLALEVGTLKAKLAETVAARDSAQAANQVNSAQIKSLVTRNRNFSEMLTQRKQRQIDQEAKLRETTKSLHQALAKDECYQRPWPADVVKRLQQPY